MSSRRSIYLILAVALAACGSSRPATGQPIRRSQAGSVSQQVAGTQIQITYYRPTARGRTLFGALVPWGRIWSPGSDSVARLNLSAPVELSGTRVPAGSYGIWMIPDSTRWTLIVSAKGDAFHLRYPEGQDVARITAEPHRGEHTETLSFVFPAVDADSATLQFRWGTTVVPFRVKALREPAP